MPRPELQEERIRISGPMVDALERLPSLRERFESVELGHPLIGSREFADRRMEYGGDRPGSDASIRLSLALDHLWTYRRMLVGADERAGGFIPVHAHLSLLRPAIEAAAKVSWLLEPPAAKTRVERALGLAFSGLNERRGLEAEMRRAGWTPPSGYVTAEARERQVRDKASAAHLRARRPREGAPGLAALVAPFFSYATGIVHGDPSMALLAEQEIIVSGETMRTSKATANMDMTAGATVAAVKVFEMALGAYEAYVEPAPAPGGAE